MPPKYEFNGSIDLNVIPAWEIGFTGKGINLAIVDDGIDVSHPDLKPNYISSLSHNWNDGNPNDPNANPGNQDYHGIKEFFFF